MVLDLGGFFELCELEVLGRSMLPPPLAQRDPYQHVYSCRSCSMDTYSNACSVFVLLGLGHSILLRKWRCLACGVSSHGRLRVGRFRRTWLVASTGNPQGIYQRMDGCCRSWSSVSTYPMMISVIILMAPRPVDFESLRASGAASDAVSLSIGGFKVVDCLSGHGFSTEPSPPP